MIGPQIPEPYIVTSVRRETSDTVTLGLASRKTGTLFRFLPGQFNMLYAFGAGDVPISISGDSRKEDRLYHTIREVGGVTHSLARLRKNDVIGLRGPFGTPWPLDQARGKDLLLIAGGLGLAALRSAVYEILSRRNEFRKVCLLYGSRTPDSILYARELHQWRSRFDLEVEVTVDSAGPGWSGNVGVVPALIGSAQFDRKNTAVLICGPEVMMRFSMQELIKDGVREDQIFLSLERNMKCAVGFCGRCQFRENFICKDGPVLPLTKIKPIFGKREV